MNSAMFERRRADRFAELIDGSTGQRHRHLRTGYDAELMPLAEFSAQLGGARLAPPPGAEFRLGLRAMLMATIDREGIGATAVNPDERPGAVARQAGRSPARTRSARAAAGTRRRTRAAVLVGVTTGAIVLSGVSLAGSNALPGDPLYPVKLSSERAQLALAGSDMTRGVLHLEFARVRLGEARRVDPDLMVGVLLEMNAEIEQGVKLLNTVAVTSKDTTALDLIEAFQAQQMAQLDQLEPGLPASVAQARAASVKLLQLIGDRAQALRNVDGLTCTIVANDELGPKPGGQCATTSSKRSQPS